MGNILYTIALILIVIWGINFFGYSHGGMIHLLLIFAFLAVVARLIQGPSRY
jgi:hypothetical protein